MSDIFELDHDNTFIGDVTIPLPGKNKPKILTLEFKWMDKDEYRDYINSFNEKDDLTIIKTIVLGWKNVNTEFNEENLEKLLNKYNNAGVAILNYWIQESRKAKEKNS